MRILDHLLHGRHTDDAALGGGATQDGKQDLLVDLNSHTNVVCLVSLNWHIEDPNTVGPAPLLQVVDLLLQPCHLLLDHRILHP